MLSGIKLIPFNLNINSSSSIGKSFIINILLYSFSRYIKEAGVYNPVLRYTPTSVAANEIDSYTIYSIFRLFTTLYDFKELNSIALSAL